MIQHLAAIVRRSALTAAVLFPLTSLAAQTNDESRLILGISAGWIGPAKLWDVTNQPIFSTFDSPDLFHLHRETRSDLTISGYATFFRTPHIGVTAEFTYLGLGATSSCEVTQDGGDPSLLAACAALQGYEASSSTATIQVGAILRPFARSFLQPYVKGLGGLAFTPSSTVALTSVYGAVGDTDLQITIYKDDNFKPIRPSWSLAAGIATAPSQGYQLRIEARETWLTQSVVTGPTSGQGFVPPNKSVLKMFPSIMVAFDIVLEKKRGRRY